MPAAGGGGGSVEHQQSDKIDELASGIDELKITAEELANEEFQGSREKLDTVRTALEKASDTTDELVNEEE